MRLAKWPIELEHYNLTISYQPGDSPKHRVADALSRKPEGAMVQRTVNAIFFTDPDSDLFLRHQQSDPLLAAIFHALGKGHYPNGLAEDARKYLDSNLSHYHVLRKILYYTQGGRSLLCVLENLRQSVISSCHEGIFSAHRGARKTTSIIASRFHWVVGSGCYHV